ncbi:IQ domain-containing protein C [Melanerpes formicivorus]|uniref:IQ domain-containing protein C n=1 Tax=Melanerpes formicivorus TaxID=211600 RepID=UPI003590179C
MAAPLESQAEAEGWRRLVRAVTRLQACVRGYLLRKRFRSLRAEYEEVVRELEGDLSRLQWRGRFLPRPVFLPEPAQEECSGPSEAALGDKASTEKPQEELHTTEQDQGCSDVEPSAQLQKEKELSSGGEGHAVVPPDLGADADKGTEKGPSAPAEEQDWQQDSSISSLWDSTALEPEPLEDCLEIPLEAIQELPRTRPGLQAYRNHLLMELLWLQQAIASRENYLMLKQNLGTPDP